MKYIATRLTTAAELLFYEVWQASSKAVVFFPPGMLARFINNTVVYLFAFVIAGAFGCRLSMLCGRLWPSETVN